MKNFTNILLLILGYIYSKGKDNYCVMYDQCFDYNIFAIITLFQ